MRPLITGNWNMHGLRYDLTEIDSIAATAPNLRPDAEILVWPPATLVAEASRIAGGRIAIAGQEALGRRIGDIGAEMLKDAGASAVIVGHSERRGDHGETDARVAAKAGAAWRAGLLAIVCAGETVSQRSEGDALSMCGGQIVASVPTGMTERDLAIGYEPLRAIGSGRAPTSREVMQMQAHIRKCLVVDLGPYRENVRILSDGPVNPTDAALALPGAGGTLVGGASLKTENFRTIFAIGASTSTLRWT